jgi:hypothetical protein
VTATAPPEVPRTAFGAIVGISGCGVTGGQIAARLAGSVLADGRPVGVAV